MKENPWSKLPAKPPFILPSDREAIRAFNDQADGDFRIFDHLMPVPYLGRPNAPVVLLNLNPGYSQEDETRQTLARFIRASKDTLLHRATKSPFYFFDASIEGSDEDPGAGTRWWQRKLGRELGTLPQAALQRTFFCVEYFPYRSRRFRALPETLPSQEYGFELVRDAMRRRALVIVMRSKALWFRAIPELERYRRLCVLNNPRQPTLTRGNMSDQCHAAMLRAARTIT